MNDVAIIGAGLAGLLAGNMLRHREPIIYEVQQSLPNNHSAVLRFRTSIVGDTLGIPFKVVKMIKAAHPWRNVVADALSYSVKNAGVLRSDRSITGGTKADDRYIAPPDLISRMAKGCNIQYGSQFKSWDSSRRAQFLVSTLPMPVLMKELNYPHYNSEDFHWHGGVNIKATIANCDAYVSLYIPDPKMQITRLSITGNEMIAEVPASMIGDPSKLGEDFATELEDTVLHLASQLLGVPLNWFSDVNTYFQKYQKISPIDEEARRRFIFWATNEHRVFSLGRFATWRPNLLLDDLVKDIRLIDRWVARNDQYEIARHQ